MNDWLKRCVFNLDLNRESVSEPRTLSGRLFQRLGARYEKVSALRRAFRTEYPAGLASEISFFNTF